MRLFKYWFLLAFFQISIKSSSSSSVLFSSTNWTNICSQDVSKRDGTGPLVTDIRSKYAGSLNFGEILAIGGGVGLIIVGVVLFGACCFLPSCHQANNEYRIGFVGSLCVSLGIFAVLFFILSFDELFALIFYKQIDCLVCWQGEEHSIARFTVGYYPPGSESPSLVKTCWSSNCYTTPESGLESFRVEHTIKWHKSNESATSCFYDPSDASQIFMTKGLTVYGISGLVAAFVGFGCFCTMFKCFGRIMSIQNTENNELFERQIADPMANNYTGFFRHYRSNSLTEASNMRTCDRCDTLNKWDSVHCERCGADLAESIPQSTPPSDTYQPFPSFSAARA